MFRDAPNSLKTLFGIFVVLFCLCTKAWGAYAGGKATIQVNGLVCDFCARSIEKVFMQEPAVKSVKVDMDTKLVVVQFKPNKKLDDARLTRMIQDSGYQVKAIEHAR